MPKRRIDEAAIEAAKEAAHDAAHEAAHDAAHEAAHDAAQEGLQRSLRRSLRRGLRRGLRGSVRGSLGGNQSRLNYRKRNGSPPPWAGCPLMFTSATGTTGRPCDRQQCQLPQLRTCRCVRLCRRSAISGCEQSQQIFIRIVRRRGRTGAAAQWCRTPWRSSG